MRHRDIVIAASLLVSTIAAAAPPASFTAEDAPGDATSYDLRGQPVGAVAGQTGNQRNCPPGSRYAQRPHQPTEPWLFLASDTRPQRLACERFPGNGEPIFDLWFWGADFDPTNFAECDEPNPFFDVTFHPQNAAGEPDLSTVLCAYEGVRAREKIFKDTYVLSDGTALEAFRYKLNFDPPCTAALDGPIWVCIQGTAGQDSCWFFWLSSPEGDGTHYEDNPDGMKDGTFDLDLSLCVNRPMGQAPFCPADVDGNKRVDVDDLVAVIVSWGACPPPCPPTCPADINGDCVVNVDDLVAVILAWGQCPTPPNDECIDKIDIDRFDGAGTMTVPFDMRGATPSPQFVQCKGIENIFKDAWWCLRNLSDQPKVATIRTNIPMLLEVTDGCVCPPGPLLACGDGLAGGVTVTLVPGQEVCLRLLNIFQLPNDQLKGVIEILNEPIDCPNDDCADRLPVDVNTSVTFDTSGCGSSPLDPPFRCGGNNASNDLWFNVVAPANGILNLNTFGSAFDTVLKAYAGFACPPSDDSNLGCNDDAGGVLQSELILNVSAGDAIKVRIGGFDGATGIGVLNVLFDEVIGPRECPPDSNYGQRPHQADENWTFGLSDAQNGFRRFEDFEHDGRAIDRLVFWGADLALDDDGNIVECDLQNPFFEIAFYLDDGTGHPNKTQPLCTYFVRASEKVRKDVYGGLATAWQYTVALDPPCVIPPGRPWISIQGAGGGPLDPPDCFFWWLSSPDMNMPGSVLEQPDGTQVDEAFDLSLCILGQDIPDPVNFYFDPSSFFDALAETQKQQKFFWNFKPDLLAEGDVVTVASGLDIDNHPINAPGVWSDAAGTENLWPPEVDNVRFSANTNPGGPLVPPDVGLGYSKAPAFDVDNNVLFADPPGLSFDIESGPPAGDNHTAFALDLVSFGDVPEAVLQVTIFDKNDNVIGVIVITVGTGQKQFLGVITKDPALTIGRIDIWDLNGGLEGISAIAAFAQPGQPVCPGEGDCCEANGTPGCDNPECCERVCANDPFCCDTEWDQMCADQASTFPQCGCAPPPAREIQPCGVPVGGTGEAGDCPPQLAPEWCLYEVKELLGDEATCAELGLNAGDVICVAICPFPGDPEPCMPNAPDPQVIFQVVDTKCRFLATALNGCEPCQTGSSQWRRLN